MWSSIIDVFMTIHIEMKTRYILFAVLALFVASFAAHAQGSVVGFDNPDGLYMTKTVTADPNVLNKWTLQMESFVTGVKLPADLDVVMVLDRSGSMAQNSKKYDGKYRIHYLKLAAKAFVDKLYEVDSKGKFRVALIQFSTDDDEHSNIVKELTPLTSSSKGEFYAAIGGDDDGIQADGSTCMSAGLRLAYEHLNAKKRDCLRYVIVFTDGQPVDDTAASTNTYQNNYAITRKYTEIDKCTQYAYDIKHLCNAKMYAIGLGINKDDKIVNNSSFYQVKIGEYLNYVSSNYLEVKYLHEIKKNTDVAYKPTWRNADDKTDNPDPKTPNPETTRTENPVNYVSYAVNPDELTQIFKDIGEAISQSSIPLSTPATTVVDKIADNFRLPKDALDESGNIKSEFIEMYAVACAGHHEIEKDSKKVKVYDFDEANPIELPTNGSYTEQKFDKVKVEGKGKEMTFSGFDFDKNFVLSDDKGHQGYKFVVKVPIVIDPAFAGGCHVPTNTEDSGVYYKDPKTSVTTLIGQFPVNYLDVPNIVVVKYGLKKGESAIFNVYKIEDGARSGNPFMLAATQNDDGDYAMAKIKLQQPGEYEVVETDWSWAYEPVSGTQKSIRRKVGSETQETKLNYTGTFFIFENEAIEGTPAHAESNVNNVFFEVK